MGATFYLYYVVYSRSELFFNFLRITISSPSGKSTSFNYILPTVFIKTHELSILESVIVLFVIEYPKVMSFNNHSTNFSFCFLKNFFIIFIYKD